MREIKKLTAKEARDLTVKANHLYETLYQDIFYAASNGKDRITVVWENVNDAVVTTVLTELKTNGYRVEENSSEYDTQSYILDISW